MYIKCEGVLHLLASVFMIVSLDSCVFCMCMYVCICLDCVCLSVCMYVKVYLCMGSVKRCYIFYASVFMM